MGTADLRLGDAFKLLVIGGALGAVGMFVLGNIKSVQFEAMRASRQAYPSVAWDLYNPGATSASFEYKDYNQANFPREGMFSAEDPNFGLPNFSALGGYEAPRSL